MQMLRLTTRVAKKKFAKERKDSSPPPALSQPGEWDRDSFGAELGNARSRAGKCQEQSPEVTQRGTQVLFGPSRLLELGALGSPCQPKPVCDCLVLEHPFCHPHSSSCPWHTTEALWHCCTAATSTGTALGLLLSQTQPWQLPQLSTSLVTKV